MKHVVDCLPWIYAGLLGQLRWRLFGRFTDLPAADPGPQYFPSDLFRLQPDEFFVDGGAFDGDTLAVFLKESGGRFRKVLCFEPDPANFQKMRDYVASLPERWRQCIELQKSAVGAETSVMQFIAAGDTSSRAGAGSRATASGAIPTSAPSTPPRWPALSCRFRTTICRFCRSEKGPKVRRL